MFSGNRLERHEVTVTKDHNHATELVYSMPSGGVCWEAEKAEILGYKTNKNFWIDQVEDKWEKYMFQQAQNWDDKEIPEEVKEKLSGSPLEERVISNRCWFSLLSLGESSGENFDSTRTGISYKARLDHYSETPYLER